MDIPDLHQEMHSKKQNVRFGKAVPVQNWPISAKESQEITQQYTSTTQYIHKHTDMRSSASCSDTYFHLVHILNGPSCVTALTKCLLYNEHLRCETYNERLFSQNISILPIAASGLICL